MKRIPSGFQLGPHWIVVRVVSAEEMADVSAASGYKNPPWGLCDYSNYTIYVQKVSKTHPKVQQMQTWWHEYFHMLIYVAGRPRLARDETLVDTLGALQLQAFNSAVK